MTKDAFMQSVVVATLALLWASPGMAQTPGSPAPVAAHYGNLVVYLRLNGIVPSRSASRN